MISKTMEFNGPNESENVSCEYYFVGCGDQIKLAREEY